MEQPKIEKIETTLHSVEDAVNLFIKGDDTACVINYLRLNRDDVVEFCMQVHETYRDGDKSGIIKLGMLIKELL